LANKPKVVLLDEPLSALDAKIRRVAAQRRSKRCSVNWHHHHLRDARPGRSPVDVDRIVVMNEGNSEQGGTPFDIYTIPAPVRRLLRRHAEHPARQGGRRRDAEAGVDDQGDRRRRAASAMPGWRDPVGRLRPEPITLAGSARTRATDRNRMRGTIEDVNFLGAVVRIRVRFKENAVSLEHLQQPDRGRRNSASRHGTFRPQDVLVLEGAEAAEPVQQCYWCAV